MAMLASPAVGNPWGEPAEIAAAVSWDRFLTYTDPMVKPYLHWACHASAFSAVVPGPCGRSSPLPGAPPA